MFLIAVDFSSRGRLYARRWKGGGWSFTTERWRATRMPTQRACVRLLSRGSTGVVRGVVDLMVEQGGDDATLLVLRAGKKGACGDVAVWRKVETKNPLKLLAWAGEKQGALGKTGDGGALADELAKSVSEPLAAKATKRSTPQA